MELITRNPACQNLNLRCARTGKSQFQILQLNQLLTPCETVSDHGSNFRKSKSAGYSRKRPMPENQRSAIFRRSWLWSFAWHGKSLVRPCRLSCVPRIFQPKVDILQQESVLGGEIKLPSGSSHAPCFRVPCRRSFSGQHRHNDPRMPWPRN